MKFWFQFKLNEAENKIKIIEVEFQISFKINTKIRMNSDNSLSKDNFKLESTIYKTQITKNIFN